LLRGLTNIISSLEQINTFIPATSIIFMLVFPKTLF